MKQVVYRPNSLKNYTEIVSYADKIGMKVHPYIRKCCTSKDWKSRAAFYIDNGRLMNSHGGFEISLKDFKNGMTNCVKNNKSTISFYNSINSTKSVVKQSSAEVKNSSKMVELPKEFAVEFANHMISVQSEQLRRYNDLLNKFKSSSGNSVIITV